MKRKNFILAILAISLIVFSSCVPSSGNPDTEVNKPAQTVKVVITSSAVTVRAGEPIDLTELFSITENGRKITVTSSMIDAGGLDTSSPKAGSYTVRLTYTATDGQSYNKLVSVTVEENLSETVRIKAVDTTIGTATPFDIKSLFTITSNGVDKPVTDDMLTLGGFDPEAPAVGEYTIKLVYHSSDGKTYTHSAKLTVVNALTVLITPTNAKISESEDNFDLKTMFTVSVEGAAVTVTDEMIDAGSFNPAAPSPGEYNIKLTYTSTDGVEHTSSAILTVISVWIGPF